MSAMDELLFAKPLELFALWMKDAEASEPNDAIAAALATSTPEGRPSVRMVLVKRIDERGFCFFTNAESKKGTQLEANPKAALCFHWKSLRRQVRIEGSVSELPGGEVDDYFHSRSRKSQIGAAVSEQSRPLSSRKLLETKVEDFTREHPGEIPRPEYWRGYCVHPEQIEFWMDGENRLHNRFLFTRDDAAQWNAIRLYP